MLVSGMPNSTACRTWDMVPVNAVDTPTIRTVTARKHAVT